MHQLKSPDELPGLSPQSHDGIGPLIVSGTEATVIVGAGATGGDKHEIALGINSHHRPSISSASAPGLSRRLRSGFGVVRGKRLPFPTQRAGASVESAYDATRHVDT